jgi:hypothetical protein
VRPNLRTNNAAQKIVIPTEAEGPAFRFAPQGQGTVSTLPQHRAQKDLSSRPKRPGIFLRQFCWRRVA